jgi:hypothetical protein
LRASSVPRTAFWYANRYVRIMKPEPAARPDELLRAETQRFYLQTMGHLRDAGVDVLVGGAHALTYHAGIRRNTKDFDLFLLPRDVPRALEALSTRGIRAEIASPLWLAKAFRPGGDEFVDLIFNSGNGLSPVDESWFERAVDGRALDEPAKIVAVEEMLWTKAFIQERERFDGADVAHLLLARGAQIDWSYLERLFAGHEQVLLAHLVLFTYIYPSERDVVPANVLEALIRKMQEQPVERSRVCRGTNISRSQYLVDVRSWGFADGRIAPAGPLTPAQVEELTGAIDSDRAKSTWAEAGRPPRLSAMRQRRLGKTG